MPARRDRDDAVAGRLPLVVSRALPHTVRQDADQLERVASLVRDGEATIYGYDVEYDPVPFESGSIAYPGGWLEFRFEHDDEDQIRGGE